MAMLESVCLRVTGSLRYVPLDEDTVALVVGEPSDGILVVIDAERLEEVAGLDTALSVTSRGYATFRSAEHGNLLLHRLLLGLEAGNEQTGDHINGDITDCRRRNLDDVTWQQNAQNRRKQRTYRGMPTTSDSIGVSYSTRNGGWFAGLSPSTSGRLKEGPFATEAEAKSARQRLVDQHGDHHSINDAGAERSAQRRGDPELQTKLAHLRERLAAGWWLEGYVLGYDDA